MRRPKIDAYDMFAVLEHQQRTAHFPAANDKAACVSFHAEILSRYDAAMMKADTAAAVTVIEECELFLDYVYEPHKDQRGVCYPDVNGLLAKANRAPDGTVPKWGQEGNFTITIGSVPVRIEVDHLCGLGMFGENLLPHFSIHIVDKHRIFLSNTGYRSFFCTLHDTEPGVTVADAIGRILRQYVERELKGKLEGSVASSLWSRENGLDPSGAGHVRVQVASIRRRDHPLGGALVLPLWHQLS